MSEYFHKGLCFRRYEIVLLLYRNSLVLTYTIFNSILQVKLRLCKKVKLGGCLLSGSLNSFTHRCFLVYVFKQKSTLSIVNMPVQLYKQRLFVRVQAALLPIRMNFIQGVIWH